MVGLGRVGVTPAAERGRVTRVATGASGRRPDGHLRPARPLATRTARRGRVTPYRA